MDRLGNDVRHAWRASRARPGTSLLIVLVKALGIGLLAAMFGLADPYVGRSLPYPNSGELVVIETDRLRVDAAAATDPLALFGRNADAPLIENWDRRADLFQHVAGHRRSGSVRLQLPGGAALLRTAGVTRAFFETLAAEVPVWAGIESPGTGEGTPTPLVLTAEAFARVFASGGESVGRTFPVEGGGSVRIVGVLPPDLLMPERCCFAPTEALTPAEAGFRVSSGTVIARLQPGVTADEAVAALTATVDAGDFRISAESLHDHLAGNASRLALGALAAGGLILLICAANLGNLLAVRGLFRARELTTRRALGATRGDFVRLMLTEVGLTTAASLVLGLVLAAGSLALVGRVMPLEYATLGQPAMTWRVVVFALATGLFLMLFGLVPAGIAWRRSLSRSGVAQADGRQIRVLRFALAAGQTALALLLLVGAAFLTRSYANLMGQESGFSGEVLAIKVSYPESLAPPRMQADVHRTIDALQRLIGVTRAGAAWGSLVDGTIVPSFISIAGQWVQAAPKFVTADYFDAVGSRVIEGRVMMSRDAASGRAVVNETLARRYFPGVSPLSQTVGSQKPAEVVGVVADELDFALDRSPFPQIFYPLEAKTSCSTGCNINYVLRLVDSGVDVRGPAIRAVTVVNPEAVVVDDSRLSDRLMMSVADRSFATLILGFFAIAGVSVALAGLVGMVAFVVGRRTHEIAIRTAVGARPADVLWVVLREAAWTSATGIVIGALLGYAGSATLEHLLFGVQAGDWVTLVYATAVMVAAAFVAALVPAWSALRISPSDALRAE